MSNTVPPRWMVEKRRLKEVANSAIDLAALWKAAGLDELSSQPEEGSREATAGGQERTGDSREVDLPASVETSASPDLRVAGRKPWQCAPSWMAGWLVQPFERNPPTRLSEGGWVKHGGRARVAEGRGKDGHAIVVKGPIAYCARCAKFALARVGRGLKGLCVAPQKKTSNATQARLNRLREGRHPITGRPL